MRRVVFDNSIHLGQFCFLRGEMRVTAKNMQIKLASEGAPGVLGVESFNENSFTDDTIWKLPRPVQDAFYRFMDLFHSVKEIKRVSLGRSDVELALRISDDLKIDLSNALTCALGIRFGASEVQSYYGDFQRDNVRGLLAEHAIELFKRSAGVEQQYSEPALEQYYVEALQAFREHQVDLQKTFHR